MRGNSLLVRFFAISVLIAGCSIAVTAWLATQATTGTIRQEQGEALATDTKLYDELLGWASTHGSWAGVKPRLTELADQTGRRIALTTADRTVIADTGGPRAPRLPVRHTAIVDPLHVDLLLKPTAPADRIDSRALGPFRLPPAERSHTRDVAQRTVQCASDLLTDPRIVTAPNGRASVEFGEGQALFFGEDRELDRCLVSAGLRPADMFTPTKTEQVANAKLLDLFKACMIRGDPSLAAEESWPTPDTFDLQESLSRGVGAKWSSTARARAATVECLTSARRDQLTPHVAPAAQLYLTAPTGAAPLRTDLSTAGTTRIALTALAILAVAMFAAWLSAAQLVRPIRAVTSAARRMGGGDRAVRVEHRAGGELGELADAFNLMSEKLETAEKQRKSLVSDIAHELRTPLGNITGWLEATQDGLATPDPELITMLLKEALLLEYLVSDLQDLALADAGTLRLHLEPIDAADLVDQVAGAHQAQADEKGVSVRAASRGPLELTGDAARLRQALGNLVANAVRYTPAGGQVTVIGRREDDDILLEVTDTGTGIAPADLPYVFERFWRADKSRSRKTGGSGLGLAITRYLTEAHGGTAAVTSERGKGSTFQLRLPATGAGPAA